MDTSDVVEKQGKETEPQPSVLNVGKALNEARERQGMSVHDVAERIKFAPRQVEALEANDFAHLPQATFLRGFVRSYARVLQLDEVSLLAALPSEQVKQTVSKIQSADIVFPGVQALRSINVLWLAGAVGIAFVLGVFLLLPDEEPVSKATEVVVEPVSLPSSDMAVSAVGATEVQSQTLEVVKVPELIKVSEPKKVPEPKKASEPKKTAEPVKIIPLASQPAAQVEAASAVVSAVKSVPLEVLKRRPLHLVFGESTWAEVIDSRGGVLLSRTNPAGSEKWIGGPRHEPYDISIGRSAKVKLIYRGKEVDLSAYKGTDIKHFKLE